MLFFSFETWISPEAMVNERNGEALLLGDAREKAERCRRQLISRVPDLEAVSGGTGIPTKKLLRKYIV